MRQNFSKFSCDENITSFQAQCAYNFGLIILRVWCVYITNVRNWQRKHVQKLDIHNANYVDERSLCWLLNHKHNKLFQYETTATISLVKIVILFQLKYYIHLSCYMTIKLSSVTT